MQMPGMNGAVLAQAIAADSALQGIRLVLMTSLGQRGDAKEAERIGFAAFLTKPARGAELFTCLSAVLADTGASRPPQPIITRHTIRERHLGAGRILLAEDNAANQQVALAILKKLGLGADVVDNGADAVKALESHSYDVVLMDLQMPGMDGMEALRCIRDPQSMVRNHAVPVIAMTAYALPEDRQRCLAAGMDGYVTKPVSRHALAEALEEWLPKEANPAPDATPGAAAASGRESGIRVFDKAGLMDRLMDDEELARMVIAAFLEDLPLQMAGLRDCLEAGDVQGVWRRVHTVRGAAMDAGAEALCAVAGEMEKAAKVGDRSFVGRNLASLAAEHERAGEAMGREL